MGGVIPTRRWLAFATIMCRQAASDPGTQDRQHYSDRVEERSEFRPQTVAEANLLSISGELRLSISGILYVGGGSGSEDARFEGEISQ